MYVRALRLTADTLGVYFSQMGTSLPFAPPCLNDAARIRAIVAACAGQGNDLSFASMYLLQAKYHTEVAVVGGILYRRYSGNSRLNGYAYPLGADDPTPALRRIEEDAAARGEELRFCLLTEEQATDLQRRYPGRFHAETKRGDADYLYLRSNMAELPGTAFHKKRNHISKFTRLHPNWAFKPLDDAAAAHARAIANAWLDAEESTPALQHEFRAICHALELRDALQLTGGVLYVDTAPVGMAIVSHITPDVADIHYEKCLPDWRDAYTLINRETARRVSCTFINREEDLDQPGLRKAKESYHPAFLLPKTSLLSC